VPAHLRGFAANNYVDPCRVVVRWKGRSTPKNSWNCPSRWRGAWQWGQGRVY